MVKVFSEDMNLDFEGTIIDLETIGNFQTRYFDSRRYRNIIPVIFGIICKEELKIISAEDELDIEKLKKEINVNLPKLREPYFAFNSNFETGTLFHSCSYLAKFQGELNKEMYEGKWKAVRELGISNYGDPFHDKGLECSKAWLRGEIDMAIAHNRSCLLKEKDILLLRGYRKPDELEIIKE
jgi:hypothetical protein